MIFFYLCPWFRQADTFAFVVSCHYNNILVIDIMILKHPVIFMRHGWLCIVTHKIKSSQCKNNFTFSLNFNDMGLITQLCHLSSSSNKNYCKMFNCVYLACLSVVLALPPPHEYPTPAPAPVVPQSRPHSDCIAKPSRSAFGHSTGIFFIWAIFFLISDFEAEFCQALAPHPP